MKKVFVLLGVLCALCFLACSNFQLAGGEAGVVSLAIGDDLASEIRSAASSRSIASGTSYTVTGVLSGEYSAESSVTVDSGALAGATISFENVPVGTTVTLNLSVQAGTNLVWIGNSETHVVTAGENSLTIALGRVSGVLMWDSSSIKIAPYGNYEAAENTSLSIQSAPVFCFDKNGNSYWYADGQNGAQRFDLQTDGSYNASDVFYEAPPFYAFTHDATTDILYGIGDEGSLKYWSNAGGEGKDITSSDGSPFFDSTPPLGFVVHDNILYIAQVGITEGMNGELFLSLVKYDLSQENISIKTGDEMSNYQLKDLFGTSQYSVTGQMIYHEGSLYLLLNRVSIDPMSVGNESPESYSLGAVLKINPNTLILDTSFGSDGYLGLASYQTRISEIDNESIEEQYNVSGGTVVYHGPTSSNDASVFYGPQGFVAIMPKKLVIADAGFTMSKSSTLENKVQFTKKSRIITVDLETLAFETVDVNGSYYQPSITSTSSGYEYIEQEETSS